MKCPQTKQINSVHSTWQMDVCAFCFESEEESGEALFRFCKCSAGILHKSCLEVSLRHNSTRSIPYPFALIDRGHGTTVFLQEFALPSTMLCRFMLWRLLVGAKMPDLKLSANKYQRLNIYDANDDSPHCTVCKNKFNVSKRIVKPNFNAPIGILKLAAYLLIKCVSSFFFIFCAIVLSNVCGLSRTCTLIFLNGNVYCLVNFFRMKTELLVLRKLNISFDEPRNNPNHWKDLSRPFPVQWVKRRLEFIARFFLFFPFCEPRHCLTKLKIFFTFAHFPRPLIVHYYVNFNVREFRARVLNEEWTPSYEAQENVQNLRQLLDRVNIRYTILLEICLRTLLSLATVVQWWGFLFIYDLFFDDISSKSIDTFVFATTFGLHCIYFFSSCVFHVIRLVTIPQSYPQDFRCTAATVSAQSLL